MIVAGLVLGAALAQTVVGPTPGAVEGQPAQTSPVQTLVDRAAPGETVVVGPGVYEGDLVIDKPLRLVGRGWPLLLGSGTGSVVRVRADGVEIAGFQIDGRGGGDLGRDPAGVHVTGHHVTVREVRIRNTLFGIYLREANGATVDRTTIRGIPGKAPGEKGSGIHVWNTDGFRLTNNDIADVRDGFYIQSSPHGVVAGNRARNLRYGLHYMFSDDNTFEDNWFENGDAGTAIMYSRRIVFRKNRFVHNRGFASVGLLFKSCEDALAEDNVIADNARGVFIEDSYRVTLRRNLVAKSDVAIVLYDMAGGHRVEGNVFVANLSPLFTTVRRTDTVFAGNYWSDHDAPDLDGDGYADQPSRLSSVFDRLRGNLTAADLFAQGLAAAALGVAERAFPVIDPLPIVDARPLARPPATPTWPALPAETPLARPVAMLASGICAVGGLVALAAGRRPRRARTRSSR